VHYQIFYITLQNRWSCTETGFSFVR